MLMQPLALHYAKHHRESRRRKPLGADVMPLASMGELIRQRRMKLGVTQEELAERVASLGEPIRQADISRIERGRVSFPRRARLEAIATALDLSLATSCRNPGGSDPMATNRATMNVTTTGRNRTSVQRWATLIPSIWRAPTPA
jgi:transcriptional regulator with XRE-family HTH domain